MYVGVDEAGRGPVLGSMFIAAVGVSDSEDLPSGVADSKRLSASTRERLATQIQESEEIYIGLAEVTVEQIDEPSMSLTDLTIEAVQSSIVQIHHTSQTPLECILDAADVNPTRYAGRVSERLPASISVVAKHKADSTENVVSAASIIAKSAREAHVETLAEQYGTIGSGYPSDPTTQDFLSRYVEDHGCLPACARTSWKTSRDAMAALTQESITDYS